MEPNEMSNEELIFKYFYSGCDNAGEHATMAVEIQNRLRSIDGMIERPTIEVVQSGPEEWDVVINKRAVYENTTYANAEVVADDLTTALGMDDAQEGGEG